MGVGRESREKALEVLVEQGVLADPGREGRQLVAGGQVPVDEQIGGLEEGGILRQLLDRVSPGSEGFPCPH